MVCGVERQFAKSIKLTLDIDSNGNYETITADYAKKMFVEMRGRFNVACNNWKRSGNGRLMANLPENGKLKFHGHGIDYGKNNDDVEELEFCDDDRYNFCQGKLEVYYFWMCADLSDDCCRVSSSVGELGLTSDDADVPGTMDMEADLTKKKKKKDKKKGMADIMESFNKSMDKTLSRIERKNVLESTMDRLTDRLHHQQEWVRKEQQRLIDLMTKLDEAESKPEGQRNETIITFLKETQNEVLQSIDKGKKELRELEEKVKEYEELATPKKLRYSSDSDSSSSSPDKVPVSSRSKKRRTDNNNNNTQLTPRVLNMSLTSPPASTNNNQVPQAINVDDNTTTSDTELLFAAPFGSPAFDENDDILNTTTQDENVMSSGDSFSSTDE